MSSHIEARGTYFVCSKTNRTLQLRGVSLSGSSKIPTSLPSHTPDTAAFFDHANVSYIGRPFPLSEMDEHLSRIRDWGFTVIRLVVTWEALEHAGWRKYDHEYIDYIRTIVEAMPKYGLCCIIDAHQDVFSRLTGGSGAPGWVLETLGLSIEAIHHTHSAHLHPLALLASDPPPSVWPTGYQKLAPSTANTVFWAGDTFAWKRQAPDGSGRGLGTFLQEAMCDAFGKLADALEGCEGVLGFEPMNEPHRGYLELHSMYSFDPNTDLQLGFHTSALESFAIGDGYPQLIPYYIPTFPQPTKVSHHVMVNEERHRAWQPDKPCIWREHGVWQWDEKAGKAIPLRLNYFDKDPRTGKPFEWYKDAWYPFIKRFRQAVVKNKDARRTWMTFAAGIPNEFTPHWPKEDQPDNFVSAPHFYDLHSLFTKSFGNITFNVQGLSRGMFPLNAVYYGQSGARNNYAHQIGNIVRASNESTGRPCIIGEIGIPFDQNDFEASRTNDYRWQERQLDSLCTGLERALTNYVLWNYNPENEDDYGDAWYGENFSLFSLSARQKLGTDGSRCADGFQRPYARATPGIPRLSRYDMYTLEYEYAFDAYTHEGTQKGGGTFTGRAEVQVVEFYLPQRRYGKAFEAGHVEVRVDEGTWEWREKDQLLLWTLSSAVLPGKRYTLHIRVSNKKYHKLRPANIDLSPRQISILFAVLTIITAFSVARRFL